MRHSASILLLAASVPTAVSAGTYTWTASGNSDNTWRTRSNWSPTPGLNGVWDDDIVVFSGDSANKASLYNQSDVDFREIRFTAAGYQIRKGTSARINARLVSAQQTSEGVFIDCNFGTVFGNATLTVPKAAASLIFTGAVDVSSGNTITVSGLGLVRLNNLTSSGTGANIVKNGTGTLSLTGANTMGSSSITVNQGRLEVLQVSQSGNCTTHVESAATLFGSGTIGSVVSRGTIRPGPDSGWGTLKINGALTCESGSLGIGIGGTGEGQHDALSLSGDSDFAGCSLSLSWDGGYSLPIGQSVPLVSHTPNSRTRKPFAGLPEGHVFPIGRRVFSITYRGGPNQNAVTLTRVPTPLPTVRALPATAPEDILIRVSGGIAGCVFLVEDSLDLRQWSAVESVTLDSSGGIDRSYQIGGSGRFFRLRPVEQ